METTKLKKFAQFARRSLMEQVSAKLKLVLAENSAARRESLDAIKKLEEAIKNHGKEQVIERVAYIWFNRFCALRFMDVNRYTRIGVVSPAEGQFQPEILAEAKMGHIDEEMVHDKIRQQIFALLDGKAPSRDPQGEAYRLLVVAACNFWNKAMPFLFQRIDDYAELLMPDDLLSGNSILAYTREAMTPDACEDVEVIGWLYQFYISEKKDEVFDGLKKNKKITPENIPAATQLFTPHWIVRYLVENSLGRLWLLNRPDSKLVEQMDYYIRPEQPETDFLKVSTPEEIKICDPACGSGHMLTYAFDLLYAIYEEEGYEPAEIPEKILTNNLFGIEIDERAGELAAFALTMKARARQRRFFNKGVKPNICVLENVQFDGNELKDYMDFVGRDLFTAPLQTTLRQFEEADNFGSLIRPDVTDVDGMLRILESKNVSGQLFISMTHQKVLQALRQADYLCPKYHVVIANPPYMGGKGMNQKLSDYARAEFPDSKTDLYSIFIERIEILVFPNGFVGLMTPFTWMSLKSFEGLRAKLLSNRWIACLVQPEYHSFFESAYVPVCAFVLGKTKSNGRRGVYIDLGEFYGASKQGPKTLEAINSKECAWKVSIDQDDFDKIPSKPIAFSISEKTRIAFRSDTLMSAIAEPRQGLATANNDKYLRSWSEAAHSKIALHRNEDNGSFSKRWFPYQKGGAFRKWFGNHELVIDWLNNGAALKADPKAVIRNPSYYLKEGMTWTSLTVSSFNGRYCPEGFIFDSKGPVLFTRQGQPIKKIMAFLNSKVSTTFLGVLAPTMDFSQGPVGNVPVRAVVSQETSEDELRINTLISLSKSDWDAYETSWDFTGLPLLDPDNHQPTLKATYQKLRAHWQEMTLEMQRLEEENNRIFIEAYGLQDELTPEVPLNEITLTCNPHYRYGNDKSEDELEALLLADTMRELVSYAVGCMFGRYALDRPGLILANQGETIEDYLKRVPEPSFPADDDNVIPMLDGDWFTDDIAERFRRFLRVAFGEAHYEENLRFVEQALNIKGKRNYSIRDYFLGEFYTDHVKRYKKRPIYWLFSSPKGSFNALIYMHRYRPDTVSVVLNDYLREFRTKLTAHKNHLEAVSISASASQGEKTKALKEIENITKMIAELEEYEREVLYPLATEQVEIDLDDGVKLNYPKLGAALKKIVGLDAKED
ncbi:type II restriction/modification system DNA methylase subunit YeeA [Nitrosomonas nitrosa]|uniref:BREX-1 system adenine-specific DNA-methyltransferase PglX n=1 Tax=Nitrosomonas nitrosa TaxID=52442 RepID=UPI000D317A39|nr:BREX-1 system adenine-specific DNA-methyltransferase PglX [Nitrosomonas nitrosa]PTQ90923.1 type II restriction/modification system DNA methylase subunit YeeA [Nitrosomonas nitrosa]